MNHRATTPHQELLDTSDLAHAHLHLGLGLVSGSLVVLRGGPGVGKTQHLAAVAGHLGARHRVLWVSAEDTSSHRLAFPPATMSPVYISDVEEIAAAATLTNAQVIIVDPLRLVTCRGYSGLDRDLGMHIITRLDDLARDSGACVIVAVDSARGRYSRNIDTRIEHVAYAVVQIEGQDWSSPELLRVPAARLTVTKNRYRYGVTGPIS